MRVLLIRPQARSEATARRLEALGHTAVIDPILAIRPAELPPLAPGSLGAVVLTSASAAPALPSALHRLPLFAVGAATAAAVRAMGCTHVQVGPGDGAGLARLLIGNLPPTAGTILHLAGEEVRAGLAETLIAAGYAYRKVTAYVAVPTGAPAPTTVQALRDGMLDALLLHSPRSAACWADNVRTRGQETLLRRLLACCLSPATAQPLRDLPFAQLRVAARPDEAALFGCLATPRAG